MKRRNRGPTKGATVEDKVLERENVDCCQPPSVRVTLNPRDSLEFGKLLAANDSQPGTATLKSVEGYEVFFELDLMWQRELQTGSAFVWISVPGARFSTHMPRRLGRDLAAVLLGESDVLVPVWMACDSDSLDDLPESTDGTSELFPVYFVPTKTDMAEVVPAAKTAPKKKIPVLRRTVPTRSARRAKAPGK